MTGDPELSRIAADVEERLRNSDVAPPHAAAALASLAAAADSADGLSSVRVVLEEEISQTKRLAAILEEALARLPAAGATAARHRLDEAWWQEGRHRLQNEQDASEARRLLLQLVAEAVAAWDLELAQEIAEERSLGLADERELQNRIRAGLRALAERRPEDALDLVEQLMGDGLATRLPPETRAVVEVLGGRIHLARADRRVAPPAEREDEADAGDPDRALAFASFQRARDLAPHRGEAHAALSSYYLADGQVDQAVSVAHKAVELSRDLPDGFIALALCAESQGEAGQADDFYDRALDRVAGTPDPITALGRLLGPVPPGLLLRLAHRRDTAGDASAALDSVERALAAGFESDERAAEAYKLKGDVLEKLERPAAEVSDAYYEAGRNYNWAGKPDTAESVLEQAVAKVPENAGASWTLSEALRIRAAEKDAQPPEELKELVERSLEHWTSVRRPPDEQESWTYVNRGLINEQFARLPGTDRWELAWEAVAFVESAILLRREEPRRWAYLAHFYRLAGMEASTLAATAAAVAGPIQDDYAKEERVIALANAGRFEELEPLLDTLAPSPWKESISAYMLARTGRAADALEIIDRVLAEPQPAVWQLELRAFCHRLLGEPDRANDDYETIWSRRTEGERDDQTAYAAAAYELGNLDDAETLFERLRQERVVANEAYRYIGLCKLARGDMAAGEVALERGIALTMSAQELDDFETMQIRELRERARPTAHAVELGAALERIERCLDERRRTVRERSSEDELLELVAGLAPQANGADADPVWKGTTASLARIHDENERWHEAATLYAQLEAAGLAHADRGFERAIDRLQETARGLVLEGSPEQAVAAYDELQLLSADRLVGTPPAVRAQLGYARALAGDRAGGVADLVAALDLFRRDDADEPGSSLASAVRPLIAGPRGYWELDRDWKALADDAALPESNRQAFETARVELATYLDEHFRLAGPPDASLIPVTTPIAMELGEALVPGEGEETPLVTTHAPAIRERVQADLGVAVPGIRFRAAGIGAWEYSILVDEALVATGRIEPGLAYATASSARLTEAGVPPGETEPVAGVGVRPPGRWVQPDAMPVLAQAGIDASVDPLVPVAAHVEAVIRHSMPAFVGMQELDGLLAEWSATESDRQLVESVLPDVSARVRLVSILRALLSERVPVTRWRDILEVVAAHGQNGNVADLVRAARLAVRDLLPGNDGATRRVALPESCEARLAPDRAADGLEVVPADAAHDLLAFVRRHVEEDDATALVVARAELRRVVRLILRAEFPSLAVLAAEELVPNGNGPDTPAGAVLATGGASAHD